MESVKSFILKEKIRIIKRLIEVERRLKEIKYY